MPKNLLDPSFRSHPIDLTAKPQTTDWQGSGGHLRESAVWGCRGIEPFNLFRRTTQPARNSYKSPQAPLRGAEPAFRRLTGYCEISPRFGRLNFTWSHVRKNGEHK